jgi:MoaA/NifB/PqqE/SkfB family radical SAM enzyme
MKPNQGMLQNITDLLQAIGVQDQQFRMISGHNVKQGYYEFVPKMSDAVKEIHGLIRKDTRRIKVVVRDLPLCILGADSECFLAPAIKLDRHEVSGFDNKTYTIGEIFRQQSVFSKGCGKCSYRKSCTGVRKEYAEFYGLSELKPIKEMNKK